MDAPSTSPLIEAHALHAWYGSSHVLHGIDVAVRPGETIGLLGRNGMGKSTLIRTLLGHVRERQGRIAVRGRDCSSARPHEVARLGIAYVPEGRGIFGNLTVRENLVMAARPAPAGSDGRAGWTLDRVLATFPRLAERMGNLGSRLSGGEQQMLSIGRALMTHPDLLILDEATEGLAPLVVAEIWRVIDTVREGGIATLIVDRDWRKVLERTDRAWVMQKGRIVLQGDSSALERDPALAGYLGV